MDVPTSWGTMERIFDVCEGILRYRVIIDLPNFVSNSQCFTAVGDAVVQEIYNMKYGGQFEDKIEEERETEVVFISPKNDK